MSGHPLQVLLVENEEDDAELILEQLRRAEFEPTWRRVDTAEDLREALHARAWDVILCDYVMPRFSGADALALLKETGLDVPFIIVSGRVGEDVAVHSLKLGAQDFFRKDRLKLLGPAVWRELREAAHRREGLRTKVALAAAEHERALFLASIKEYALFTLNPRGVISSWNPGVERVLGYASEEFIGQPHAMLFPPEDVDQGLPEAELRQAMARGGAELEGWRVRKEGSRFWAEAALTPLFDSHGTLMGYSKVMHDITERKQLIEELRAAVRVREQFLTIASHELKTPLTALQLQLQSMAPLAHEASRVSSSGEKLTRKLQSVSRQVSRLSTLIESLLDVSLITEQRMALQRETLDLAEFVREIASRFDVLQTAVNSPLNIDASGPVVGCFDRMRMDNVITHLLSNAFKFGAGKPVDLLVEAVEGQARLTVRDGGIGIRPEDQARIFERFERAVPETNYGGFGIGLWIARQVVEAHGGHIEVKSQPGLGSTFVVNLPQQPPA